MRTCSLGYCTDIVWLSIIVIWSLCLRLRKSHFIFSLGFNLFCAPRKFFHSVTFTAAFSAFFFFPFRFFSNGAQRHNTSRRTFFFHFHLKMETLKIHPYHCLPIEQMFPFRLCRGKQKRQGAWASLLMQQLTPSFCSFSHEPASLVNSRWAPTKAKAPFSSQLIFCISGSKCSVLLLFPPCWAVWAAVEVGTHICVCEV